VLEELREELNGVALPEGFETHFRGGSAERRRFLDLFGGFVASQIKHDAKFRAILTTGQLSRIEGLAFDTATILSEVAEKLGQIQLTFQRGFSELSAQVAEIKALLAAGLISQSSR
jgi:hypothetical protein